MYIKMVYGMTIRPPPKVVVEKHEGYRTIIQNGVFGGHRPGFFEWVVYTDEMVADEALSSIPDDPTKAYIKRTLQCRIICDAVQAKALHQWLSQHIAEYEKSFGKIVAPG
ncbi:MAG: DUF3467 domain-containing protein, partial [Candidatus Bathyarchaeota archaeon]|nr:DUF3467 domain-containing protein [Candidatus Bathyarchaeota archaeon]